MQDFEQLDYYALLGVEPSASPDAVKRAYRQQIARFHPDRYVNSSAAEQAYAQQRAQRINEAYGVLSNASQRAAYNREQRVPAVPRSSQPVPASPAPPASAPRDHQAELYAQASAHLGAGRTVQALATLRQLQQINPFYRDVAALIAQAEAQQRPAAPANRSRRWLVASAIGGVGAVGLVAAALAWRGARQQTGDQSPTTPAVGIAPTVMSTTAPTAAPTEAPTSVATVAATNTAAPTAQASTPTAEVTEQPTTVPTPLPSPVLEEGAVRVDEPFSNGAGWARSQQEGWSVGYADGSRDGGTVYEITADPGVGNIWSYRTAPGDISDYSLGVDIDVQGAGGSAGLLLRFQDRANYLICLVNPTANTYRVEQHRFGRTRVLADEQLPLTLNAATPTRLVARISGSALTVIVNQTLVLETDVNGLPDTPLYGLVAAAGDEPVVAQFDNLELR